MTALSCPATDADPRIAPNAAVNPLTSSDEPPNPTSIERSVGVLVVDDNPGLRGVLRDVIASLDGFAHVGEAVTGEAALELAAGLQPDLALVDIQLPGISGTEVARSLATVSPDCVVILMSADEALLRTDAAMSSGAADLLRKRDISPRTLRALWIRHGQSGATR
jgi:CheY-like chemotaxis protein